MSGCRQKMPLDLNFIVRNLPMFGKGLVVTVELSLLAILFAMVWGLVVAFGRMARARWLRTVASAYIEMVRDTPVLVQMYFIYFGFSMAGFGMSGFISGLLALSLQNGGYIAEIYRAGIESISVKQVEGGKALGMSRWDVMSIVVLPQALVRVIPPLANQLIVVIKDTSLVSTIAVADLTQIGKLLTERSAASYEVFLTIAVLYLMMTGLVSGLSRLAERQFAIYH
jgi:His/Glu/Gln/Arg/opine family amino acid ABC transporter permease subunit